MRYKTKFIGGPIGKLLRRWTWAGVTLPIPFYGALVLIWTATGNDWSPDELQHEVLGHVPQVARMGAIRYLVRILYEYARYGHELAPMEIEARRQADASNLERKP